MTLLVGQAKESVIELAEKLMSLRLVRGVTGYYRTELLVEVRIHRLGAEMVEGYPGLYVVLVVDVHEV